MTDRNNRLGVETFGDRGAKRCFVFVHGWGASKDMWRPVLAKLLQPCYAVALDLPGTGDVPISSTPTMDAIADRIRFVMDELEIASAVVVGHSLGGHAAAVFALSHPERIEHLVLVSAPTSMRTLLPHAHVPLLGRVGSRMLEFQWKLNKAIVDRQELGVVSDNLQFKRMQYLEQSNTPRSLRSQLYALRGSDMRKRTPAKSALHVLLTRGARDVTVSKKADSEWQRIFPGSTKKIINGGGHNFIDSDPEQFVRDIYNFCSTH